MGSRMYQDDAMTRDVTEYLVSRGTRVFQPHWLAEGEGDHVSELLKRMEPPPGARILDVGCGVGGVADRMMDLRPDLEFVLLNISEAQLAMCPVEMYRVHSSFEDFAFPDQSFDVVMLCYSLGHMDLREALVKAWRLLKPRGFVFLYDLTGPSRVLGKVDYECRSVVEIRSAAEKHFPRIEIEFPEFHTGHFSPLQGSSAVLDGTRPAVLKMWRE